MCYKYCHEQFLFRQNIYRKNYLQISKILDPREKTPLCCIKKKKKEKKGLQPQYKPIKEMTYIGLQTITSIKRSTTPTNGYLMRNSLICYIHNSLHCYCASAKDLA